MPEEDIIISMPFNRYLERLQAAMELGRQVEKEKIEKENA